MFYLIHKLYVSLVKILVRKKIILQKYGPIKLIQEQERAYQTFVDIIIHELTSISFRRTNYNLLATKRAQEIGHRFSGPRIWCRVKVFGRLNSASVVIDNDQVETVLVPGELLTVDFDAGSFVRWQCIQDSISY